jgi:beta-galactosidase
VKDGGLLIAEGCFGYFSAGGHAYEHQPSRGIDALVGAKQDAVSFAPDRWQGLEFDSSQGKSAGGIFKQSYVPTTGKAIAWYRNATAPGNPGGVAVVDNNFGKGKTRIIGTMAGYGYKCGANKEVLRFFASVLPYAGVQPLIRADYNTGLVPRIWANAADTFLWCLNQETYTQEVILELNDRCLSAASAETLRGTAAVVEGRFVRFTLPGRDAAVYKLNS